MSPSNAAGTEPQIHIVGTGLAGLSAALHLAQATRNIHVYDAAGHAGGRCRSYYDRELGCRIDNGNHLILSGNVILRDYLMLSDAEDTLTGPDASRFPFMDLRQDKRWVMQLNRGIIPWWVFNKNQRVPDTALSDYLSVLRVLRAKPQETVAELTRHTGMLYERFWEPLCISVLNITPELGSAQLLGTVLAQSFALGGAACRPLFPRDGMSETFVDPCLQKLATLGINPRFNSRLQKISFADGRAHTLHFGEADITLAPQDWLILAVPPWVASTLLPDLLAPTQFCSIINAHFRLAPPAKAEPFAGLVGGVAEWVFTRSDTMSVTVSAAERYADWTGDQLIAAIWRDVARYYRLDANAIPPHRIVKEKRATFAATPQQNTLRPKARTNWQNVVLAGDWTQNELPSTLEGAARSGLRAAQLVTRWLAL
jgi:hydroxysqualene dehydroxylase